MYSRLIVAALTALAACGISAQTDESVGSSAISATPSEAGQPEMTGTSAQIPEEPSASTTGLGTLPEVTPSSTSTEEETSTFSDDAARCGGSCPGKPTPSPAPLPPPCPGGCPLPPKPTYCDVCPPPVNTYTPPPSPPQPTCDTDCPITLTISMPPKPTQTCPPRPDCNNPKYTKYYKYGYKSGKGLTNTLLQGHDDCADVDNTVRTLQDNAPSYPSTLGASPSLYCRKLGVYTGFLDAVDVFEKKCTVECRDDGAQIGAQAAILLCNLPTARVARIDLCQISFDAGCALSFEQTVRDYCPSELNTARFNAVKSQVCAFTGPAK